MTHPPLVPQTSTTHPTTTLLKARDLRKTFGLTQALRGASLDIQQGEITAIMGPSGSGKSTLLHLLAGVLQPDSGNVEYQGRNISAMNDTERSRLRLTEFGFVFQFGQLLPDLDARDNAALPLLVAGTPKRQAYAQAESWLDRLGLSEQLSKLPAELSGGQAQRVAIARALVTSPKIIFADEPTGSLDSLAAEQVLTAMTQLSRDLGVTVILITHDPRTAAYADREIIVRDGKISAGGAIDAIS